ncbi:MAG: hypothetical protein IJY28_08335, partial [Clostridia bacterium]|nr:hypothetical protein [Clostridia bacterium]
HDAYEWTLEPGIHTVRVEKLPAIFCRGWMSRAVLYHLSMMSTEFSLQSVMENADAWVMEITVDGQEDLHLRVKVAETRLVLTEGNAHCREVILTRSASPEAVKKVKIAYLMPIMVLFGLMALLFGGVTVYYVIARNIPFAVLFALGTAGWCVFSWKNLHRLWHSDRKTKKQ